MSVTATHSRAGPEKGVLIAAWAKFRRIIQVSLVLLVFILFVSPVLWMFVASIHPEGSAGSGGVGLFSDYSLSGYRKMLSYGFGRNILNSLVLSSLASLIATTIGLLAAYGFSRFRFSGRLALFGLIVVFQMFPFVMVITPLYAIYSQLGIVNSYAGLIIAYVAITQPFAVLVLYNYMRTIPVALDEAAELDGCGTLKRLWYVILPLARPGVVAVTLWCFSQAWEDYLLASVLISGNKRETLSVALQGLFGQFGTDYQVVMAAAAVGTLPTLLLFLVLQRSLVASLEGGLKS